MPSFLSLEPLGSLGALEFKSYTRFYERGTPFLVFPLIRSDMVMGPGPQYLSSLLLPRKTACSHSQNPGIVD